MCLLRLSCGKRRDGGGVEGAGSTDNGALHDNHADSVAYIWPSSTNSQRCHLNFSGSVVKMDTSGEKS